MRWIKLECSISSDRVEEIEEVLSQYGALATSLSNDKDQPLLEENLHDTPLWNIVQLQALFSLDTEMKPMTQELQNRTINNFEVTFLADDNWVERGTKDITPRKLGNLWLVPRNHELKDKSLTVQLDPGLAFGTGEHPTTLMCLEWLIKHDLVGRKILDFGCGSGILCIAALKLGAQSALGVDNDPLALTSTQENGVFNDVSVKVTDRLPDSGSFDVILGNIHLNVLLEHSNSLCQLLGRGGTLVLTGILEGQEQYIEATYPENLIWELTQDGEWILMVGTWYDRVQ